MLPNALRLWIDVVKRMDTDPDTPVACPACDTGSILAEDVRSEADPEYGTRIVRCTRCGHHSTSRYRFGPQAVPSASAAAQVTKQGVST